jgi:hypothetical protein
VTPYGAFEFVDSTEAVEGDGVELAGDRKETGRRKKRELTSGEGERDNLEREKIRFWILVK